MVMILAFLTMLIDHVGMMFFPSEDIFRIIGRISFPLFAWGVVRGYKMTKDKMKYAKRLLILALISQSPFFFINQEILLFNVCFTLFFGLLCLGTLENKQFQGYLKILIIIGILGISEAFHFDYGMYGILTVILLYLSWQKKMSVVYFSILTFLFYGITYNPFDIHFHLQFYAMLAPVILYFTPIQKYDFPLNFYFKYGFYPVHLLILYLIYIFTS